MVKTDKKKAEKSDLRLRLEKSSEGMFYLSETDAEIAPFFGGPAEVVTLEALLKEQRIKNTGQVEERSFDEFFSRLTKISDWFGATEKANANRFGELKRLLQKNLKDLKVFRIGKIRIDIYVVGIDKDGNLAGIKTMAVET